MELGFFIKRGHSTCSLASHLSVHDSIYSGVDHQRAHGPHQWDLVTKRQVWWSCRDFKAAPELFKHNDVHWRYPPWDSSGLLIRVTGQWA